MIRRGYIFLALLGLRQAFFGCYRYGEGPLTPEVMAEVMERASARFSGGRV